MLSGFIYKWIDVKTGLEYIGRHEGTLDDGYTMSGTIIKKEYLKRLNDFYREILWFSDNTSCNEILIKEEQFLKDILDDELYYGKHRKYYNQVKNSHGFTSEDNPMKFPEVVQK